MEIKPKQQSVKHPETIQKANSKSTQQAKSFACDERAKGHHFEILAPLI